MYETKPYFYGTGRRKCSVARVRVYTGTGKIIINGNPNGTDLQTLLDNCVAGITAPAGQ